MSDATKLDVKSAGDVARENLPPERAMKMERVDVPPVPPRRVNRSVVDELIVVLRSIWSRLVTDAAAGKPIQITLPSVAGVKWIALAIAVIVLGLVVLRVLG